MSEIPGPDVDVIARAPAHPAPITMPIAAISSSAWTIAKVALPVSLPPRYSLMYEISVWGSDDGGVFGYRAIRAPPAIMQPMGGAAFPSRRIIPAVLFSRSTQY